MSEDAWVVRTLIEYIQAYQAHPVPKQVMAPRGPFPPELLEEPEIVVQHIPDEFEPGATAQNNYRPKWFRCSSCHERVRGDKLDEHFCEE